MTMLPLIIQAIVIYAVSWCFWRLLRQFVVRSPLDNIPGPPSRSVCTGHLEQLFFDINGWDFHKQISEKYGPVIKFRGLLGSKNLYIFDPKAIHSIVVKDQYTYEKSKEIIEISRLVFGIGLLGTKGDQHRKQRKMLNPVFSISHMRHMIPNFYQITYKLRDVFSAKTSSGPQEIEVLEWMTRVALELIGQSGLGHSFDPLTEDSPGSPYAKSIKNIVPALQSLGILRLFLPVLTTIGSPKFRRSIVEMLPWKKVQKLREMIDIINNTSVEIFEAKRLALKQGDEAVLRQVGQGKDIMSILLKANMESSSETRLSEAELLAQMSTLIFAAMDTTSGALAHILHILASEPDAQEKLRMEITDACERKGELSYDDLVSLPYLDAVCRETLRLYPPVSFVSRMAQQDIVLPLSKPVTGLDGKLIHEIVVPKNTNILLSILSVNRSPEIWGDDASEWNPGRWLQPLPDTVADAHIPGVYSHMLTFLGGGRACIGFKFSQLEMKVVLSVLLKSFRFSLPAGKNIVWNMSSIQWPSVNGAKDGKPHLSLVVTKVNQTPYVVS